MTTKAQRTSFTSILILLLVNTICAQNIIPLGKGSYSQSPPAYKASRYHLFPWPDARGAGDKSYEMVYDREIFVVEENTKPIPTNDWLTSIFKNQYCGELWAYPLTVSSSASGLTIEYPHTWNSNGTHMESHSEILLKGVDFNPTATLAKNWGDWTMEFVMPDNNKQMNVTLGHGLPFVWIETQNITPILNANITNTFSANADVNLPTNASYLGIEIDGDYYGIYTPEGTYFENDGNNITINLPSENSYLSIAALPSKEKLEYFSNYAYTIPRDSKVDFNYIEEDGTLYTTWNLINENLKGDNQLDAIQGFIPHHYRTTNLDFSFDENLSYNTPRGLMQSAVGNSFSINYKFNGLLPVFPTPTDHDLENPYDSTLVKNGINDFTTNTVYGADTYWGAKDLVMKAQYAFTAKALEMESASEKIQKNLITALSDWYTFDPGETEYCFTHYPNWGAMVGYNTSYFSDEFTDHHFHYGYFSFASGLLGLLDKDFINDYGPMAKLVAADYANWKRDDNMLPYFRTMDIWAGHSYAGGLPDGGNGQESSSEAMQSWGGLFMLAMATNDNDMRDAAIFGYVSEAEATAEYWYDRYKKDPADDFPARNNISELYTSPYNSNLESGGIGYWNWFSGNMGFNHAIQWIPWSPAMKYLYADPEFSQWDHDYVFEHWVNNPDGWANETDYYNGWAGMASIDLLSSADAEAATAKLAECRSNGLSVGTDPLRHYMIHSDRTYGKQVWDRFIDYPLSSIYYNENTKQYTYVVYNNELTEKTFNVYDYDKNLISSFKAPAEKLTAYQNEPVLSSIEIVSNAITIPVNDSMLFKAITYDQYGATIESDVTWSVTGGGSINTTGVFKATENGAFNLTAASGEVSKTISIRVNDAPYINSISISAESFVIEREKEMQFSAEILDQYGDVYTAEIEWNVNGGGEINNSGLFKANTDIGIYKLTVNAEDSSKTVDITVRIPLVNVALSKDAYASSYENVGLLPEYAVDGVASGNSRWSSEDSDNQYWAVDLKGKYNIDYITINWETAHALEYEIYGSESAFNANDIENHTWGNPLFSTTKGTQGLQTIELKNEYSCFYVKCIKRATEWGFSILEFEAFGLPVSGSQAELIAIEVTPNLPEITDIDSIQLSAQGIDQFGNSIPITPIWSMLNDENGSINVNGWFKPAEWQKGLITVKAEANGVMGLGKIIVQPSFNKVSAIEIQPETTSASRLNIAQGMAYKFNAIVTNQFDWETEGDITWTSTGGGTFSNKGFFNATEIGDYEVYANCQGLIDTAFISVTSINGVNIALNKPVSSSAIEGENFAANGNDGNSATRWASAWEPEAFWTVDLQAVYTLTQIEIDWEAAFAKQYNIEVSTDNENWTQVYSQSENPGGTDMINTEDIKAKYIRVNCTERQLPAYGYSFYEFRAYASALEQTPELSTIEISPERVWISSDTTFQFLAQAYDQFGDSITVPITWSNSGSGSIDQNGVFTPNNAGTFMVYATSGQVSSSSKVTVLGEDIEEINQKPICSVLSPTSGRLLVNETTEIIVEAIDFDGEITKVEFFVDEVKVGENIQSPYTLEWTPTVEKNYLISAIAFDSKDSTLSAPVEIRCVGNISDAILVISSTGSNTIPTNEQVTIQAKPFYFTEDISSVDFYLNNNKVSTDDSYPYEYNWLPKNEGTYSAFAVANTSESSTLNSDTIQIVVIDNSAPEISFSSEIPDSIVINQTLNIEVAASDSDGTITKVEFFINGSWVGEVTETPYAIDWIPTELGLHIVSAKATDNFGTSTITNNIETIVIIDNGNSYTDNSSEYSCYPNPAKEKVIIKCNEQCSEYQILKVNGSLIKRGNIKNQKSIEISINELKQGIYFVRILSENNSKLYKLIKQ